MNQQQPNIRITPHHVSVGGEALSHPPKLQDLLALLPPTPIREHRRGEAYLPAIILDELGLLIRYQPETQRVALVDVFFATSQKPSEPAKPFCGSIILNGTEITRPFLLKKLNLAGDFNFDTKPTPAAGTDHIGISIVPKFEFVGIINFGWKTGPSA